MYCFRHLLLFVLFVLFLGNGCTQDTYMMKQIKECLSQDGAVICLKERVLELLNETIVNENPVTIYGVFDIVRDPTFVPKNHLEFLPRDLSQRNEKLNELLHQKIEEFFESRSVKLNLGHMFEARAKKDKKGGMLMMGGLAMAGMMAQMFMGKIAFMAGAALLVAKLALLLSTVIGFKKLSGGGGGGGRDFKTNMLLMGGMTMAGAVTQLVMASVGFLAGAVTVLVKSVFLVLVSKRFDIKDFINKGDDGKKKPKKKKPHKDKDHHKDKDKDHHHDKDKNKCKNDKDKDDHKDKKRKKKKKKKIKNDKDHIKYYDDNVYNYNLRE